MGKTLLHVFKNTPKGREVTLQSLYFCKLINASIVIYIPEHTKFLMYYDNDAVQVDLNKGYTTDPATAKEHAEGLAESMDIIPRFIKPKNFTAASLPDIPVHFDFMCCPSSIANLSSKISPGHIGPRARGIINAATFPILMPSHQFKEWRSIAVFFGGSVEDIKELKLALFLKEKTGFPLDIFTQADKTPKEFFEKILIDSNLDKEIEKNTREWYFFKGGKFRHNLYNVPHDALCVLGAYDKEFIKDLIWGSTVELVQKTLPNPILIAGPNYIVPND